MSLASEIKDFAAVYSTIRAADRPRYASRQKPLDPVDAEAAAATENARSGYTLPSAIPESSSVTPQGNPNEVPLLVKNELLARGVHPEVVEGVDWSLAGESGRNLNPTAYNPNDNGGPSGGFAQWHGPRLKGLYAFAGSNDLSKIPAATQAKYLGRELDTTHAHVLDALKHAKTKEEGNDIWTRRFEVPADVDNQVRLRAQRGKQRVAGGAIPAYAAGGLVEDASDVAEPDDDVDDVGGYDTARATPAAYSGDAASAGGGLLDGIGEAIGHGLKFLQETFGLNAAQGAIPESAGPTEGLRRFMSGEGAASPAEMKAIGQVVDPRGELTEGLRSAAGLNAAYKVYLAHGEPQKAAKIAQAIVQHQRMLSAQYGEQAERLLRSGDTAGGVAALEKAQESIPDGTSVQTRVNQDGTVDYTHRGPRGETLHQARATPQQLLAAATGMKDGSAYWGELVRAASGKYQEEQPQEGSPAYQEAIGGLLQPQGGAPAPAPTQVPTSQQAIPTSPASTQAPAPSGVTPEGNQLQAQAIPTEPPAVPMASPQQLAQMSPKERNSYLAARSQLIQERQKRVDEANREHRIDMRTQRQIDAEDRRAKAAASAIPKVSDRTQAATAIHDSMEQFKATLPDGQTLAPADERAITTAASHLFDGNNIAPGDAVDAAMDLTDPNNKALDEVKFGDAQTVRVPLQNGTTVDINRQAFGALKTLRAKKVKDASDKVEAGKNAFLPRAGRAMGAIAENSAVGRAAPYAKLAGQALQGWLSDEWQKYQNSKPSRTVSLGD